MIPRGGTELMMANLSQQLGGWPSSLNLIVSNCSLHQIDPNKKNIVWQHLDTDQEASQGAANPQFQQAVACWIFVSEWQREKWVNYFGIHPNKTVVIRNAIHSFNWQLKPASQQIEMIYTSTPWRGLDVLLDAIDQLQHQNWRLTVYSSTIIYGKGFSDSTMRGYQSLFDRCRQHTQIQYVGYGLNQAVRKRLQGSHLWVYPSTFPETSCISAIEAASAGCQVVTTRLGALEETLGESACFVDYTTNKRVLSAAFAKSLDTQLSNYDSNNPQWQNQALLFDKLYSWNTRIHEWQILINQLVAE
jgi:glycosyltransferase involved in cell wall biosynthesis